MCVVFWPGAPCFVFSVPPNTSLTEGRGAFAKAAVIGV